MTINSINTANAANIASNSNVTANATGNVNTASGANAANIVNTVNTVNAKSIADDTAQTTTAPKSETVQAGQQTETTQVQQNGAGKDIALSKAFSVALEGVIATEISELARTVVSRTALVNSLPPEIKELVQQVLNQNQAVQTSLAEGLVALLKSPKTVSENLATLVDIMETTTGLSTQAGSQKQLAVRTTTSSQQLLVETAAVWQGETPDDLTSAPKVLRELAAALQPNDKLAKQQEPAVNMLRANTAGNTQPVIPQTAAQQASQSKGKTPTQAVAPQEQSELMMANKSANPVTDTKLAEVIQRQQGSLAKPGNNATTQPLAPNLGPNQPASNATMQNLARSLPPEVREFVLSILQQDPSLPAAQTVQTPQTPQTNQTAQTNQAVQPNQTIQASPIQNAPGSIQQASTPVSQPATTVNQVLQTGQHLQQLPAALAELMTTLNKSRKSPVEKITELASFLEQAADAISSQQPQNTQSAAFRQQALEEMAKILQEYSPEELKDAIKVVKELADAIAKPNGVTAERQEAQKVLTFAMPLYFGDGQTVYPAYIHVYYQEEEDKKNPGQKVTETWLRICLETENIGIVDVAFRLYDENNLDVKVRFAEEAAAIGFARGIDEVKEQLSQLPLTLGDILVR